uniref:CSON000414 protein n=1 Tax=Culicoides sonorensis TaxID=179676 RepID=A0A336KX72_CULSO
MSESELSDVIDLSGSQVEVYLSDEDTILETPEVSNITQGILTSTLKEESADDSWWTVNRGRRRKKSVKIFSPDSSGDQKPLPKREKNNSFNQIAMASAGPSNNSMDTSGVIKRKKMFFSKSDYPNTVMNIDEFSEFFEIISKGRSTYLENGVSAMDKVKIDDLKFEDGGIKMWISDGFSETWVKNLLNNVDGFAWIENDSKDELIKCNIKILKRKTLYSEEEFISQLVAGNRGLQIKKLELISKSSLPDGIYQIVTFKLDRGAVDYLEKINGRVQFDLMKTYINFPRSNPAKKVKLDGV